MNANDKFIAASAHVDDAAIQPLPNSRKIYVTGSRPDIRVPMREISPDAHRSTSPTRRSSSMTAPAPTPIPTVKIDIRERPAGTARRLDRRARRHRRTARPVLRLRPRPRRPMPNWPTCASTSSASRAAPRPGMNVTPDALCPAAASSRPRWNSSPSARTSASTALPELLRRQHPGQSFGAAIPKRHHPRVRPRRSRPRPRHHPRQHQPPGIRADDHRPQLPGQDQLQHRQLAARLLDPGRGRQDDLGDPLGRRHGDGSVHRQEHPRDARMDRAQFAGADRHRADLPGAGEGRTARPKT